MTNSRRKGKDGELDFAHYLTDHGFPATRGAQHSGSPDSPDVKVPSLPDVHFEVKCTQRTALYEWLEQSIKDGGPGKLHVVAHHKNRKEWMAILPMEDFIRLLHLREVHHADQT